MNHDGDSDSTGSIAGQLLGAALDRQAIPTEMLLPESEVAQLVPMITSIATDLIDIAHDTEPANRNGAAVRDLLTHMAVDSPFAAYVAAARAAVALGEPAGPEGSTAQGW